MTTEPSEPTQHDAPPTARRSTPARLYGALGSGHDHYLTDEANAAALDAILPGMRLIVDDNRACLRRMTATAADRGIRQYLDLGSGLPDQPPHLHEAAQERLPGARFVYVDRDPQVCTHGRALLRAPGVTMLEADLRDIDNLFGRADLRHLIDTTQPICVVLGAVLHFLTDQEVISVMAALRGRLAPGSLLLITHATSDQPHYTPEQVTAAQQFYEEHTGERLYLRTVQEIADLTLTGRCVPLRPGLVTTATWQPDEYGLVPVAPYFTAVAIEVRAAEAAS